eukprot:9500849-Lingulodinium_polyedra.AAC.1
MLDLHLKLAGCGVDCDEAAAEEWASFQDLFFQGVFESQKALAARLGGKAKAKAKAKGHKQVPLERVAAHREMKTLDYVLSGLLGEGLR